jgi:hypothetical protein
VGICRQDFSYKDMRAFDAELNLYAIQEHSMANQKR